MAVYAIGDVQGCYDAVSQLLERIRFDPSSDRLWSVGDLVNRGPDSLKVVQLIRSFGDAAIVVLGNHDLHLLALAEGFATQKPKDTIDDVLAAPDRDELLTWLRHRPLMHVEDNHALLHAGLLPSWTIDYAQARAREAEGVLRGEHYRELLREIYGDEPRNWSENLSGNDRLRTIINVFTRLRICDRKGVMDLEHKAGLDEIPRKFFPWFDVPERASASAAVIFGHWSALGLVLRPNLLALDSGCVWGRSLSAVRLEDRELFQVGCADVQARSQ